MIYLHKILKRLPSEDLVIVSKKLSPLQQQITAIITASIDDAKLTLAQIHEKIKPEISNSYLRKEINAIINTIYSHVGQNDPCILIEWLAKQFFHTKISHEVKKIEKQLLKQGDTELLSQVYFTTIERFLSAYIENIDLNFIDYLIQEYSSLNPQNKEEIWVMKCQKVCAETTIQNANPIKDKASFFSKKKEYEAFIRQGEKALKNNSIALFHLWLWKVKDDYDKLFNNGENQIAISEKLIEIYLRNKDQIKPKYYYNLLLRKPLHLYDNSQFVAAYEEFKSCFEIIPFQLTNFWYDTFAQCCIVLGHYDEAEQKLIEMYRITDQNKSKKAEVSFSVMAVLSLIYALKGHFKKADEYMTLAINNCDKGKYAILYLMIKYLETGLALLKKDWILAAHLNENALKFYRYHKGESFYQLFYDAHRIFHYVLKHRLGSKKFPQNLIHSYEAFQQGEMAFLGVLLNTVLNDNSIQFSNN